MIVSGNVIKPIASVFDSVGITKSCENFSNVSMDFSNCYKFMNYSCSNDCALLRQYYSDL